METAEESASSKSSPISKEEEEKIIDMETAEKSASSKSSLISKDEEEKIIRSNDNDKEIAVFDREMTRELHVSEDSDLKKFEKMIYEGLVFESEKEAYEQYLLYAEQVGFSVRKDKTYVRADGSVRSRYFVCFREGVRRLKKKQDQQDVLQKERKEREETRIGCKARMQIKSVGTEWIVGEIVHQHNHPLGIPWSVSENAKVDKDKRIRELSEELQHEKRFRAACEEKLDQIMKDVEEHAQILSSKVELIVNNLKRIESEEESFQIEDNT